MTSYGHHLLIICIPLVRARMLSFLQLFCCEMLTDTPLLGYAVTSVTGLWHQLLLDKLPDFCSGVLVV